jgi:hypothetical protein
MPGDLIFRTYLLHEGDITLPTASPDLAAALLVFDVTHDAGRVSEELLDLSPDWRVQTATLPSPGLGPTHMKFAYCALCIRGFRIRYYGKT